MYGYVIPDKMNMFMKDYYRYRAFYCGLCKCIGHKYTEAMRFTTNYDMTFVSLFAHGVTGIEPEFKSEGCVLNPIKKKAIAKSTELMEKIAEINTLLMYYKLTDDEEDKGKTAAAKMFVRRHYVKAAARFPELDRIYAVKYGELRKLEKEKCDSIDKLSDTFGVMMRESAKLITEEYYTDDIGALFYNIGKYVYVMDAIDDVADDYRDKTFNPFLIGYDYSDRIAFNRERGAELESILTNAYVRIKECYSKITLKTNEGVITNILWYGIYERMNSVLKAEGKLPLPKV